MIKLNCLSAKGSSVNEQLKTIHEVFHVKIYTNLIKCHRMENNIPTLYILQRASYVVKSAKIRPFCPKNIKH